MGEYYGYARVSTEEQSDYSLQNQLKYLEVQSGTLNMQFIAYSEKVSGKNTQRPELQKVLSNLKEGDVLGVYDNSRLGRDTSENLKLAKDIHNKGARLHINGSFVDLDNPNHELMLTIESAVSTFQRKNQNLKSRIGIETKKESGEWIFRGDLLGYDVMFKGSQPIVSINEKEAEIIKFIFDEYEKTKSINQITKELSRLGWRTRDGKTFHPASVRRYILKPIYMGYYLKEGAGGKKGQDKVKIETHNLVESKYYPPIVSEEQWWNVYNSYKGLKRKHARQFEYRWSYYPLTGIIRCGYCGSGYVHHYVKNKNYVKPYYTNRTHNKGCKAKEEGLAFYSAKEEFLEPLFENILYSIFMWDTEINQYLEEQSQYVKEKVSDVDNQITEVESSIKERQTKVDNLYKAIEQGLDFDRTISRIQSLQKEITELEDSKKHLKSSVISEEQALEEYRNSFTEDILKEFVLGTNQQKREIYKRFFHKVEVTDLGINIELVYPIRYVVVLEKSKGRGNLGDGCEILVVRRGIIYHSDFTYRQGDRVRSKEYPSLLNEQEEGILDDVSRLERAKYRADKLDEIYSKVEALKNPKV